MLTRSTPLRRTPINRGTSTLTRSRMKVYRPKPTMATLRDLLQARSGGWCEARLFGCAGQATDVAHRISRKAGGRPSGEDARLSNVAHLCRPCHRWTHDNPAAAYELGLMLREHHVTELEPMAYRDEGWVLLGDDGSVVGFP